MKPFLTPAEAAELRKESDWAASTRIAYAQQLRRHVLPALGQKLVGQVRHMDTEALYSALAARGLRRESIRQVRNIIDGMFSWLRKQGIEVRDVRADLPRRSAQRRETAILTDLQIQAVMADATWTGIVCRVMLFCGLRPGEALALRHCDIEVGAEGPELVISRASKRDGIGTTKTQRTRRVTLPPMLETELRAQPGSGEDLLFPRPRIGRGRADMLMSVGWLGVVCRERYGVNPRQFRATFATLVSRDSVNVAAMLGHSSPRTTEKFYMRPIAEESARAVRELEQKLRRAG